MLSGMLFQLNWNPVPTYLEQESNLAVTRLELKKLTTRAYLVRRERWRLEVGRVSWWRW
ncbi:thioesterase [Hoylesella loescheii]|uniref:thioesterase n=2 Tax=Hoylesella loescheii TaxID=840 RepID=UPI0028ED50FC|nr:thioesterase [Hoylesella loescheii]